MDTTYICVSDDTKIEAQVVDEATTEVTLTTRFGQRVVMTVPTPRDGQRAAVAISDAIWQAEKRGPERLLEDPRKLIDDEFGLEREDAF